jgi:ARG/rhodanese/phosphatase superfamily protein
MPKNPVAADLASITLGPEVVVHNLTMIPLLRVSADSSLLDYCVLDEALASGAVEITEVSEQGSVPDLKLVNRGSTPVLIVDGEELLGAKQNRIVNLTILVAANSELTIPVSCVEAGRWRARSRSFTSAPRTQFATGRAKRMASVSCSMVTRGDRVSDQSEVWSDIAEKSSRLHAASPTSAMDATGGDDPLLPHIVAHLASADHADIVVSFALATGRDS